MEVAIVGGGIAGLYAALKMKEKDPSTSITILEKSSTLGGRAGTRAFVGTPIMPGAGVGRKDKDHRLTALLKDMHIPYHDFVVQQKYSDAFSFEKEEETDLAAFVRRTFYHLRRVFRDAGSPRKTFQSFAKSVLGLEKYKLFVAASGYSDYEQENAEDTLYHYGFDDNFATWNAMGIAWKDLVQTMAKKLLLQHGGVKIVRSATVTRLAFSDSDSRVQVHWKKNDDAVTQKRHFHRVILATTVDMVRRLLPQHAIYQHIHAQPFVRIYGQFASHCRDVMKAAVPTTTVVPGPLHKIIPINPDKGIYMIAYTDNADAKIIATLSKKLGCDAKEKLCRLLEQSLALPGWQPLELLQTETIIWPVGTHYYDVLPDAFDTRREFIRKAQRPHPSVRVVGEMVAMNQGWVEGALESVHSAWV